MGVYENVKAICDEQGIPICEAEKRAGLANGTIGGWRKYSPSLNSVIAVSKGLKVPLLRLTKGVQPVILSKNGRTKDEQGSTSPERDTQ